jgi:hypothetical protein
VAVRRELHAVRQPLGNIGYETMCRRQRAVAEAEADDQFRVSIERSPRPNIAPSLRLRLGRRVLFLRAAEGNKWFKTGLIART